MKSGKMTKLSSSELLSMYFPVVKGIDLRRCTLCEMRLATVSQCFLHWRKIHQWNLGIRLFNTRERRKLARLTN